MIIASKFQYLAFTITVTLLLGIFIHYRYLISFIKLLA